MTPTRRFRKEVGYRWQRAAYAGEYRCDELETLYRVSVDDGGLRLQINNCAARGLVPATKDVFVPIEEWQDFVITFVRDEHGSICGLTADLWKVKGVQINKTSSH